MRSLTALANSLTEGIKINSVTHVQRDARVVWLKRRRWTAAPIMAAANAFFRLAGAPVRTLPEVLLWQEWEVGCFRALHGEEGFVAFPEGSRCVGAQEMPGTNLTCYLDGGSMTPGMAAAAGRELRRAHGVWSPPLSGLWSHGDPHAGNFIYQECCDRARLIDFEVMHEADLPEEERHADDVLVFLQDMAGRIAAEKWLPCAEAFLAAYDRAEILELLQRQLVIPKLGLARLWWGVRTTFLPVSELRRRIAELRCAPVFQPREAVAIEA
jgi:hypothetical protein